MPRILLIIVALTTAIALASGCGRDGASSSGAASLAPAGSLVYGEATLRPEGERKAAIEALVAKFPGEGSAGERISRLLEKSLAESDPELSYARDFEPWIGDEAAFFVSGVRPGGGDADAALLVASDDEDATVAMLEKDEGGRKTDYRGRDLYLTEEDSAAAVVEGWFVLGNPAGVKAAIDVAEGGDPIGEDEAYEQTLEDAPEERLGFVYLNAPAFAEQLRKSPAGAAFGQFRRLFAEPVIATMDADEAGVRVEATLPESLLAGFPVVAEGSDLAAALPADAWLAMAQPELGKTVEGYADLFGTGIGGRDVIEQQLQAATGLDLEEDVISWMGDWGVFVRGTSVAQLDGALVVETSDEGASGRFIDALARLARKNAGPGTTIGPLALDGRGEGLTWRDPGVPQPIHLFQRDGKVVFAYGDAAARDALDPGEKLGESASFAEAKDTLGGDYAVSFYLAVAPILELADAAGAASDEGWQEARAYLEPLGALVGGARKDGDKVHTAFGLSVK